VLKARNEALPPVADAQKRIACIKKAASGFQAKPNGLHKDAVSVAEHLVNTHLEGSINFSILTAAMDSVVRACDLAKAELLVRSGEGRKIAWPGLIREMTRILKMANLPIEVGRKGKGPFTALVWEIQRQLPKDYAEHMGSREALGQAINRAR
jgi:hypothetical protein